MSSMPYEQAVNMMATWIPCNREDVIEALQILR